MQEDLGFCSLEVFEEHAIQLGHQKQVTSKCNICQFPCMLPDTALSSSLSAISELKAQSWRWGQQGHLELWQCRQGHSRCCTGRWQHPQHLQQRAGAAQGAHWPARAAPPTCWARHGSAAQSAPQRIKSKTNSGQQIDSWCKTMTLFSFQDLGVFSLSQQHSSTKWKSFLHQLVLLLHQPPSQYFPHACITLQIPFCHGLSMVFPNLMLSLKPGSHLFPLLPPAGNAKGKDHGLR